MTEAGSCQRSSIVSISNELAHWQTALVALDAEAVYPLLRKSMCAVLHVTE